MTRGASPDAALLALIRAIAARQTEEAARLLAASPDLSRQSLRVGASRQSASSYFFESITHYAYAGDSALHLAAAAYDCGVATALLAAGANPGARNRRGAEPLHYAADGAPGSPAWDPEAQAAIIAILLRAGANPNALDKSGVAPLHRAVRTRCAAAVRALLGGGAAPRGKSGSGATPLHLAVQSTGRGGSGSEESREQQKDILLLLLQHGARPTDQDARGKTVAQSVTSEWIRELLAGR